MRRLAESDLVLLTKHPWKLVWWGVFFGVVNAILCPAWAAAADRFAPQPWGIDSPAGRCVVCHSLERGGPFRVAPNLWGVIGAQKAWAKDWYAYSPALITKGGVWTEQELDEFLADASRYLPGTRKSIRVSDPAERRQIIEFLKQLRD